MTLQRTQALLLAAAAVAGYAGAAAFDALALPSVPIATTFGPSDGLTRYLLTADSGSATPDLLAGLEAVDGVVNAQRLHDGHAFVATKDLTPADLDAVPGVAAVELSQPGQVFSTGTRSAGSGR
jgi:serine protease